MAKLRARSRKRVPTKKRTNLIEKRQDKRIKRILKQTLAGELETKSFKVDNNAISLQTYVPYSYNLFYSGASQGTSDHTFLGDELIWRGLKVHYQVFNLTPGAVLNDQPFQVKFMIVSTPVYKAISSLSVADIRDSTTTAAGRFFLKNDAKIHYQKVVNMQVDRYYPTGSGVTQKVISGSFWFRRNQKIKYKDLATDYSLKDRNYYLVMFPIAMADISGYCGTVALAYKNYFKDP